MVTPFPEATFTIQGDAAAIADVATQYSKAATSLRAGKDALGTNKKPDWHGSEADTYRTTITQIESDVSSNADAYNFAATTIDTFADQLSSAQKRMGTIRDDGLRHHQQWETAANHLAEREKDKGLLWFLEGPQLRGDVRAAEAMFHDDEGRANKLHTHIDACAAQCAAAMKGYAKPKSEQCRSSTMDEAASPIPTDVAAIQRQSAEGQQGSQGDCYLIATLIGWGANHPDEVARNMRWDADSHTYKVTLHGFWGTEEVTVDPTKLSNDAACGMDGKPNYISIYENAYQQLSWYDKPVDGMPWSSTYVVTGRNPEDQMVILDPDGLADAAEQGRTVTLGTTAHWAGNMDGMANQHVYLLLGRDSDGKYIVKNPWGPATKSTTGRPVMHLTRDEFNRMFVGAAVEEEG